MSEPYPPPPGWSAPSQAAHAPGALTARPGPPPAQHGVAAAHKPGAIPLRPLGLGDMYDAAFKIIRFNPARHGRLGGAGRRRSRWRSRCWSTAALGAALDLSRDRRPVLARRTAVRPSRTPTSAGFAGVFGSLDPRQRAPGHRADPGRRDDRARGRGGRHRSQAHPRPGVGGHARQALAADRPHPPARARRRPCSSSLYALTVGRGGPGRQRLAAPGRLRPDQRARCSSRSCCGSGSASTTCPCPALMLEPIGVFGAVGRGLPAHRQVVLADLRHRRCSPSSSPRSRVRCWPCR